MTGVVMLAVSVACGGGAAASPATGSPATPTLSASPAASAGGSPSASPSVVASSAAASASPSASASGASCVDRTVFDLLRNARDYSALTQDQVDSIVTALEAFDYGADATGAAWRDGFVAALKAGDREKAQTLAGALVMGRGFGEPIPCPS